MCEIKKIEIGWRLSLVEDILELYLFCVVYFVENIFI